MPYVRRLEFVLLMMGQEPGLEYHFQDNIDQEGHRTYAQCKSYLRKRKTDFSLYAGSDAIMPIPIIGGIATQVEPKRDIRKHFRGEYWDRNQFLQWMMQIERETQARPIWRLGKITLDPSIVITDKQWAQIRRAADDIYRAFHDKCKELAEKDKGK